MVRVGFEGVDPCGGDHAAVADQGQPAQFVQLPVIEKAWSSGFLIGDKTYDFPVSVGLPAEYVHTGLN